MTAREFVLQNPGGVLALGQAGLQLLNQPTFRHDVLVEVQRNGSVDASGLLRLVLEREVALRRRGEQDEFENLYRCAFLLWRVETGPRAHGLETITTAG